MQGAIRKPLRFLWRKSTSHAGRSAFVKEMAATQFLPASRITELQADRLRLLLTHCLDMVPYYSEALTSSGSSWDSVRQHPFEALHALPVLDKTTIRSRFEDLKSKDLKNRKWKYNTSGGSTGEPVRFVQDTSYTDWSTAAKELFDSWTGYRLGDPKVILWGSERDLRLGSDSRKTRLGRALRNHHWLNTFRMTDADMQNHVRRINAVRPVQILAYAESAYQLAKFIERMSLDVHAPHAVMTSAGMLQPHMREVIERVFRARVFDRYGSREVGDVSCECTEHQGQHVNPMTQFVEILNPKGEPCAPGEVGELAITVLSNMAMPLIRYRIGDLSSWADQACRCGRNWPLLNAVHGRVNSIIRTSAGAFDSAALGTLLYFKDSNKTTPFGSFSRYQLIQVARDRINLKIHVIDEDLWQSELPIVREKLRILGEQVHVDIQLVDRIEESPSGKLIFIWSELES